METARFRVALTRTQDAQCRVVRTVRRSEPNRAVFYASNWLLQTQRLENYFGVTYNVYEIYKQNPQGEWELVETGDTTNAETRRKQTQQEKAKSKQADTSQTGRTTRRAKVRATAPDIRDPLVITDNIPGPPRQQRRSSRLSPFQQRINAEMELARQRVAERKIKGEG